MAITSGLVWTLNCIAFISLFAIWNKSDALNFCLKVIFLGLAVINAPPAWTFLQSALH